MLNGACGSIIEDAADDKRLGGMLGSSECIRVKIENLTPVPGCETSIVPPASFQGSCRRLFRRPAAERAKPLTSRQRGVGFDGCGGSGQSECS